MSASTKELVKAVQKISSSAGCTEHDALKMFVQCSLMAMVQCQQGFQRAVAFDVLAARARGGPLGSPAWPSFTAVAVPEALGFETNSHCPMDRVVTELSEAQKIHMEMVKRSEPFADMLTDVFHLFVAKSDIKHRGQFFSPADLASKVVGFAGLEHASAGSSIGDPCCGAGALVLSALRQRHALGSVATTRVWANDIDPLCSAMTALQLHASQFIHRLPVAQVQVTVGDCIKREYRLAYQSDVRQQDQEQVA